METTTKKLELAPPALPDAGFDLATVVEHAIWFIQEDTRCVTTIVTTGEPYVQIRSIFLKGERAQDAFAWVAQLHHALARHKATEPSDLSRENQELKAFNEKLLRYWDEGNFSRHPFHEELRALLTRK